MSTIKPETSYVLNHPENGQQMTAVYRGYWFAAGRNVGLKLRFPGEPFDRCLKYSEIDHLQRAEEEQPACT